jgi:hypothetical protein
MVDDYADWRARLLDNAPLPVDVRLDRALVPLADGGQVRCPNDMIPVKRVSFGPECF